MGEGAHRSASADSLARAGQAGRRDPLYDRRHDPLGDRGRALGRARRRRVGGIGGGVDRLDPGLPVPNSDRRGAVSGDRA